MNHKCVLFLMAALLGAMPALGADNEPLSTTLPILPPESASYQPRGGRNLAERVRIVTPTGDFFYWETDLMLEGSPLAPVLQRFYRSQASNKEAGLFGRGWRTIFERRLVALDGNTYAFADEWGKTWLLSKTADGQWRAERGPARWIESSANGLILHDADGLSWGFDPAGRLIAIADDMGQQLTIERDRDRPTVIRHVRDSRGNSLSFDTNADGLIERVASSDGRQFKYEYNKSLLIRAESGSSSRYMYDKLARPIEMALPNGSVIHLTFDERGRIKSLSGNGIVPRTYAYGERGQPGQTTPEISRTSGLGEIMRWRIPPNSRRIEMVADSLVSAVLENTDRGSPAQLALGDKTAWQWKYDEHGRMTAIEGPQNETMRFLYSGNHLQPDRVERPDGSSVRVEHDPKQRSITVGIEKQRPWRYEYDESGRLRQFEDFFCGRYEIGSDEKGQTAPAGETTATRIALRRDPKGRIVSVALSGGTALRVNRDAAGRVEFISDGTEWLRLEHNDSDNLTSLLHSQGHTRRFYYTAEGLPSTLQGPHQAAHRWIYDSERNCVAFQRPDQTELLLGRGPRNQIRMLDATGRARWTVEYDDRARPISCRKEGYEPAQLDYDGTGRLRTIAAPSGERVKLSYARNGQAVSLETPLRRFRFVFDTIGRPQTLLEATSGKRDAFEYDEANRLVRRTHPGWTEQYRYNRAGYVTTWIVTDLASREFSFRYNDAGWLDTITYPNGIRSAFDYDGARRLTRVSTRDSEGSTLFAMPVDCPTSSRLVAATGAGSDRFVYRYDANLALVEIMYPDGRRDSFAYDSRNNLASATRGAQRETYRRDALGRPAEVGATRYVYVTPSDSPPPLTNSMVCLTLDDRERVVALQRGDGLKARYDYLPDGRMVRREVKGRVVWFDWDGPRLRSLLDEHGRLLASIRYDPTFGLPLAVVMGTRTYFCHPDAFGQPALLTDEKGKPIDPPEGFPLSLRDHGKSPIGPTWEGLPPAIRLPEEGLQLVRGRPCDPRSGDFLSPDLFRFVESVNPYCARTIARPVELTKVWDQLTQAIRWMETIERNKLARRWPDEQDEGERLCDLVPLLRQPELFEAVLLKKAFRHNLDPDRWFDPPLPRNEMAGSDFLLGGLLKPPPSPADLYSDFSPLGPIPYESALPRY